MSVLVLKFQASHQLVPRMGSKMAQFFTALARGRSFSNPAQKLSGDELAHPEKGWPATDELEAEKSAPLLSAWRPSRSGSSSRSLLSPFCSPVCSWRDDDVGRQDSRNRARTPSPCLSEEVVAFHTVFHKKRGAEKGQCSAQLADVHQRATRAVLCL